MKLNESFTTHYDEDDTFPFVEDENGNITGYGHQDPATFAAEINRYDEVCNDEPYPDEDQWDESYVGHTWVTLGPDEERLLPAQTDTPGAFPVTTLWGQR